jgi:sulfatase modifying factor 1
MLRNRAFVVFGGWLTVLAIASVSQRSHAAGREGPQPASSAPRLTATTTQEAGPQLGPLLAKGDPAIFGSFIKPGSPAPAVVDQACPGNMVEVEGDYCPYVLEKCARWLDPTTKLQCAEFEKPAVAGHCFMKTERKRFCIDRYEWPNKVGELPQAMASWNDAKASCESIGKRLCSDTEWTLACEGPERHPYPYGDGYARDGGACNMDKPYVWPNPERVYDPETSAQELARLDQREPSGARSS